MARAKPKPRTKPVGRTSKLTPQVQSKIIEAIRAGTPLNHAGVYAGIGADTLKDWMARGEGRHSQGWGPKGTRGEDFGELARLVREAQGQAVAEAMAGIRMAGMGRQIKAERSTTHPDGRVEHEVEFHKGQWQALAWSLERVHPRDFAPPAVQMQLSGPGGGEIPLSLGIHVLGDPLVRVAASTLKQRLLTEGSDAEYETSEELVMVAE